VSPLQQLLAAVPLQGQVRWIGVRPTARAAMLELEAVQARREAGLTGDHSRPGPRNARQVTLIQREHLAVIGAQLGRPTEQAVTPQDLRRNIAISGINPARPWRSAWAQELFKPYAAMAALLRECYKAALSV